MDHVNCGAAAAAPDGVVRKKGAGDRKYLNGDGGSVDEYVHIAGEALALQLCCAKRVLR